MQIVGVTGDDYSQYEELLLYRDELEKEAENIFMEYTRVFGDITAEIFKLKIDCIALKKSISYCVKKKNRGEKLSAEDLQKYIAERMSVYQSELDEMMYQNELSKKGKAISSFQSQEIKRIYREIAKLLHPDISDLTEKYPSLANLFQQVMFAYKCNDYKRIKELEILVNRALRELGEEDFVHVIPDIEEKIKELENEIQGIISTEPYVYKNILRDHNVTREKLSEYEKERDSYLSYKTELESKLKELQGQLKWQTLN